MVKFVGLLLVFITSLASALQITIEDENFYSGQQSKSVILANPSEIPIAVEAKIVMRSHTIDGKESLDNPFNGLRALPAQMIIGSGEEQVVNLRLMQQFPTGEEVALRLIIETVPIKIGQKTQTDKIEGGLELVYRIVRSLYLTPKSAKPSVQVTNIDDGNENLIITMDNVGNAHQIIYEFTVELDGAYKFTASTQALKGGINLLAGETRQVTLTKPNDWPLGKWTTVKLKGFK